MARIRTIKPSFFRSRTIDRLSLEQRLTFIGLWTHVDDEGRCEYDSRLIKADIWPLTDRTAAEVDGDIRALTEVSLITHYAVGDRSYLQVNGWSEHQRINRPTASKLPKIEDGQICPLTCGDESSVSTHGLFTEPSRPEGKGREGNREGNSAPNGAGAPAPSETNAGVIVGAWVDAYKEATGRKPNGKMTGQVGREARQLLEDGADSALVLEAAKASGGKGFPTVEREYAPLAARRRKSSGQSMSDIDINPNEILGPDYWSPPSPPREIDEGPLEQRQAWFRKAQDDHKVERIAEARAALARRQERESA